METSRNWAYQSELKVCTNMLLVHGHWRFFSLLKTALEILHLIRFVWSLNKDLSVGIQRLFGSEVTNTSFLLQLFLRARSHKACQFYFALSDLRCKASVVKTLWAFSHPCSSTHSAQDTYSLLSAFTNSSSSSRTYLSNDSQGKNCCHALKMVPS